MAIPSFPSSSAASAAPSLGFPMTEKLTRTNHPLWKAQVVSALRVAQLAGYINASV
jgi:hypothetical protein